MEPYPEYRIVGRDKKGNWTEQLFSIMTNFAGGSPAARGKRANFVATQAVVLGRSKELDRWTVIYAQSFPTTRRAFNNAVTTVAPTLMMFFVGA